MILNIRNCIDNLPWASALTLGSLKIERYEMWLLFSSNYFVMRTLNYPVYKNAIFSYCKINYYYLK